MDLALTDDQQMMFDNVKALFEERAPLSRARALRDAEDELGYAPELWRDMAEMGLQAIPFPESYDGLNLGVAEMAVVAEAMGRCLASEPYLSSVVMAGQLLLDVGSSAQKEAWLPGIAGGEKRLSLAYQEKGSRYEVESVALAAKRTADGYELTGTKIQVLDANEVDGIIVVARTAGGQADESGLSLFIVSPEAPGVRVVRQHRLDSRNVGMLELEGVSVSHDALVGEIDAALVPLERAIDRATAVMCAEMLGAATRLFEVTLDYLRERIQFDRPIGSFQALQHRASDLHMDLELCRTTVMVAARSIDECLPNAAVTVSAAKARCNDTFLKVANEALQMHGGVGMTDEYDIGFFIKRARVCQLSFGDSAFHRNRFAVLSGF